MQTPDSHRIRTIRYRSPPPDLIGLELLLFVRVPGIQIIHEEQGMLCPAAGPCHLGPASPKPAKVPCLPLPSCGKTPLNLPGVKGHLFQSG
jgi:hypothetical protein